MSDQRDTSAPPARDARPGFEQDRRARGSLIRVLRVLMLLLMGAVTLLTVLQIGEDPEGSTRVAENWETALILALGLAASVIAVDVFTPVKKISTIGGVFLGLLAGMLGAVAFGFVIELIVETYDLEASRLVGAAKVLTGIALCYLGVTIVLQTQDDFRLIIPYVEFAKQIRGVRPVVLDTSALIDGRIDEIAQTGFVHAPLVIPRFVIGELQLLSDSGDKLKRARGRRGLEMVTRLQRNPRLDVTIDDSAVVGKNVDAMIVELAQMLGASVMTTDTGLARVAGIQGVGTLNLNELAGALKPNVIPGEELTLELIRKGEQTGQAVGYLDDGTMVVVENGVFAIGSRVAVTVTSTLQTSAGRMIFGRLEHAAEDDGKGRRDGRPAPAPAPAPASSPGPPPAPSPASGPPPETEDAPERDADPPPAPARESAGPRPPVRPDPRRSGRRNPRR